ncbi:TolC family protein [Coprobacter secundus]|uniref:Transporter n=1 Tax=Coprobacter secundus subsp. similis TaxID=2751153 RepID=A0A7G1I236_9BACT|nr:TolC family protein [Coprobacter secundus]BCI64661.1 transporter [Coprobacter secundus subsp. similis]
MERFLKKMVLSVVLISSVCSLCAQETKWSLENCIRYAMENNIQIRQKQLEKENNEIKLNTARMSRLPDLNAGAGQDFYFGRSLNRNNVYEDQSSASTSFRLSTSIPVFSGFRINNQVKGARLDLKASIEDLNKAREDVALNVTSYYLQVLFKKEILDVAQNQLALSKSQLEKTEKLVEGGKNPESALYESRALVATDELSVTQAENEWSLALVDLAQLLNLGTVEGFDIQVPNIQSITIDQTASLVLPKDAFKYSVENRPGIKAAMHALESSRYGLKQAKAGYYPSISFGASYGTSYYHAYQNSEGNIPFSEQMKNNGSETVGLSLSVPLFNRFTTRNQVKQARVQIAIQQLALENAKSDLYKEIEQAYYTAVAAHKKFTSSQKSVDAARIAFEYEQKKYDAGKSTIFEYTDAKTRYEKSLSEQVQARYEFLFRSKVLDFYNGKPLEF